MFNKETEYALRGLVYIQAQNLKGLKPGIVEIAKEIDAPMFYTGKIMQRIAKMGFVLSMKGKNGGFYFDPEKNELPLREIILAIEGVKSFSGCGFGLNNCDEEHQCPLHKQYAPIRNSINELVSQNTIQSLVRNFQKDGNLVLSNLKLTR